MSGSIEVYRTCMSCAVVGVGCLDQYVYVLGGYDSHSQLRTVERYNTETDTWEDVAPMNTPRSALSVAVVAGKVFALGKTSF